MRKEPKMFVTHECLFLYRDVVERDHTMVTTAVAQWLRYCATNRKVDGSISVDTIGIFH